ncbi:helix-turn-helix domain-containing protein [Kutzneria sp. NPDC051319]|uniref:TetR/AcrR family transcriptional regulator n=1 Tax=Kutzneria sp. NPDC051319 TaxID=3155047 RepID=UPI0034208263
MPERRLDARLNHERVLVAAAEVFAEHGLQGTVPDIAARAGVGKATVYRNYPTKDDLVAAVVRCHVEELERRTVAALAEPEAYQAFARYVVDLFATLAQHRLLADALAAGTVSTDRILALQKELLAAAGENLRPDITVTDILVLVGGAVRQMLRLDIVDEAAWRRYGEMVVAAFRR